MCLPVHISSCKQIIMLVGPSYLSRLWCIVEIFLFSAAVNDMTRVECIALEDSTENASKAKAEEDVRRARFMTGGGIACLLRQTLESSFSAVSKPTSARKYAFESSRRDLYNALLCTALKAHKIC